MIMATLEQLDILGIRSFGPDEAQKLKFINPVTLIHGPNGTGKTTVIECLRYATTGDQPPNTKNGAFLFDPKLSDQTEIKAQVRLQFNDVSKERCLVTRSQRATSKGSTVTTKTLDVAFKRLQKNGEVKSLDSRCADINSEMKHALGVSAPILQNVIFCHQEESNWPLSEGKALKQKFDDIFASTRYVKALDSIAKTRKEMTGEIKIKVEGLRLATRNKTLADDTKAKVAKAETEKKKVDEEFERVRRDLQPIEAKLVKIYHEKDEIDAITRELVKKQAEHSHLISSAEDIKESLKGKVMHGSTSGLKQALVDFEQDMKNEQTKLVGEEDKITKVNNTLKKISDAEREIIGRISSLEQEKERHDKSVTQRDEKMRMISRDLGLSGFSSISGFSQQTLDDFNRQTGERKKALQKEHETEKARFEDEDSDVQKKLDEENRKKAGLDETARLKRETVTTNRSEIKKINLKLGDVEASSARLDEIAYELTRSERELKENLDNFNSKSIQDDIQKLKTERGQLDLQLKEIGNELDKAHEQSEERAKLKMLVRDKREKEDQIKRFRGKVEDTVMEVLSEFPSTNLARKMETAHQSMTEEIKSLTRQLQEKKMAVNSDEMRKNALSEKLAIAETEISNIRSQASAVCDIEKFDETLGEVTDSIADLQDRRGLLHGIKEMFVRYHRMLTDSEKAKEEQKCPLCKRFFAETEEVDELVHDLDRQMKNLPQKLEAAEKELELVTTKNERLQQLVPQKRRLAELEASLPGMKRELIEIRSRIEETKQAMNALDADVTMKRDDEEALSAVKTDVIKIDQLQADCLDLSSKIDLQETNLSSRESVRSVKELQEKKDYLQTQYDTKNLTLESLQKRMTNHTDAVQRLNKRINDLTSSKLSIQEGVQEKVKLEEQKANLQSGMTRLNQEVENALDQIGPTEREITSLTNEKRILRSRKDAALNNVLEKQGKLSVQMSDVHRLQTEIQSYVDQGKAEKLADNQSKLELLKTKQKQHEEEHKSVNQAINHLNKQLAEQKMRERELLDNLKLRDKQEEVDKCAAEVETIGQKVDGLDTRNMERTRKELELQRDSLTTRKLKAEQQKIFLQEKLNELDQELSGIDLKDAHKVYMDQNISLKIDQLAAKDLDKYASALDRAIMTYHSSKMAELNRIVRDLWRETYRGHDIDYIEIRSADDSLASNTEARDLTKRKSYNYRVVMVRDRTEMDMRGRCSAGQKVLASLIIRLALAETFCLSCGILALDEPTTNLDVENIESLASALAQIIKQRAAQKNFQLIVITHDTMFVETLGRETGLDFYYKIGKNVQGKSELRKSKIDEIML